MCVPLCTEKIAESISRRKFLKTLGLTATAAVAAGSVSAVGAREWGENLWV